MVATCPAAQAANTPQYSYDDFTPSEECAMCHVDIASADAMAYQDIGDVPDGDRIFRMPYFDPQGRMTVAQWNTASFGSYPPTWHRAKSRSRRGSTIRSWCRRWPAQSEALGGRQRACWVDRRVLHIVAWYDRTRERLRCAVKKISINFAGPLPADSDPADYPFKSILESRYTVEISDRPDYVFMTQNPKSYRSLLLKFGAAPIRIFNAGEAIVPDFNLCDYGIGFDPIDFGDRYFQIHPLVFFGRHLDYGSLSRANSPNELLASKDRFCNFVYSNPQAHPYRDGIFHMLSRYKKVDSAGRHLNNYGDELVNAADWREAKVAFQQHYKFSIAFENATHRGYTTEKLINPMLAGSIPIYWGNPEVGKCFNTRSFVNCHEFDDLEAVVARITEIDGDESLYAHMANEPWLNEDQVELGARNRKGLERFLFTIFDQPLDKARRRADGFWNGKYEERFRDRVALEATLVGKACSEWRKAARRIGGRK